ncbi:hypothetical protein NQ314_016496 [Rhamnusium bicolor]|uniref:DDE Tnp4 domain-containing protein n=1 Tax=Rhamnusium bicolor TaxID=1586634 RepID=A0AAV8WWN9_9CUCU|nr:hypothetical protein NQ314_016496 [Rhamnusium bicolor]
MCRIIPIELTNERRIFNYWLSRARRVVENAFGILASRFRIFHTSINVNPTSIDIIVMTCCALHNFLRRKYSATYTPMGSTDYEDTIQGTVSLSLRTNDDSDLTNIERGHYRAISNDGKQTRELFLNYVNNEGNVSWQKRMCNIDDT